MNEEPLQISALIQTPQEFLALWNGEYEREPEFTAKPGCCRFCGTAIDPLIQRDGFSTVLPNVCCSSCYDTQLAEYEKRKDEERANALSGIIPCEFRLWDQSKGNNSALRETMAAFSTETRKGVVLHGPSGSCKTRILWEIVKHCAEDGRVSSWQVLDAHEAATSGIPKEAYFCDVLCIDDLGNEPKSNKFEMALLHLFRKRFDWHRICVITTQLTGLEFKQRFFNGSSAEAILRRLRERCASIAT